MTYLNRFVVLWCTFTFYVLGVQYWENQRTREEYDQRALVCERQHQEFLDKQDLVTASYIKAWSNLQATAEVVTTWGDYYKERKFITKLNHKAVADLRKNK